MLLAKGFVVSKSGGRVGANLYSISDDWWDATVNWRRLWSQSKSLEQMIPSEATSQLMNPENKLNCSIINVVQWFVANLYSMVYWNNQLISQIKELMKISKAINKNVNNSKGVNLTKCQFQYFPQIIGWHWHNFLVW